MEIMSVKCPYCKKVFDYSKEEIEWTPIFKAVSSETVEKYVAVCKHCGKKIEFCIGDESG